MSRTFGTDLRNDGAFRWRFAIRWVADGDDVYRIVDIIVRVCTCMAKRLATKASQIVRVRLHQPKKIQKRCGSEDLYLGYSRCKRRNVTAKKSIMSTSDGQQTSDPGPSAHLIDSLVGSCCDTGNYRCALTRTREKKSPHGISSHIVASPPPCFIFFLR